MKTILENQNNMFGNHLMIIHYLLNKVPNFLNKVNWVIVIGLLHLYLYMQLSIL